ncbi:MAG: cytochrome c oxidase subunit 3 [Flavobacteriales bacterium]|nr:cytochrome c oxidase subunit 3 [Flavobacteriales bacterium]
MAIVLNQNKTSKQLLWVGIAGIVMFFAGLTSAVIVRKAEGNWLEFQMPDWFWISTIAIISSSILLHISKRAVKNGTSPLVFLLGALALGVVFTFSQFFGWNQLVSEGVYLTGEGSNPAGSFLYVITLAHLLHLLGGLIAISVTTVNSRRGKYTAENYLGIELTSTYWHFLGVLWLYLFFFFNYL